MADKAIISTKKLTAIADAIRGKNMSADTYTPDEMATAISNIGTDDNSKIINSIIDGSITEISNSDVTAIMNGKFAYSTKLKSVNFPNVTELNPAREGTDIGIFSKCSLLKDVQLPKITNVPSYTFYICKSLTSADFPLVTDIGVYAFYECNSLTSADFPLVTYIGSNAFSYCNSLTSADFPLVTKINYNSFSYCNSLTSANFPLVTKIDGYAFRSCNSLTSLNFPLVTDIGYNSFYECKSLTSVDLPLVTNIDYQVFLNCQSLTTVIIGTPDKLCTLSATSTFVGTPIAEGTGYIYVADALVDQYKAATNWSVFANQIKPISEYKEKEN